MERFDVAVVGGGIAGASVAYELAADHSVLLLEAEDRLAAHTPRVVPPRCTCRATGRRRFGR